jgi:carbohydrate diacid regulator
MAEIVLDAALAAVFVNRLGEHLAYNINIIDREGVIIASRDPSRVGSYHEAAHRLIASGGNIEAVPIQGKLPQGVKPGVNLPIIYKGDTVGVVGVTGDPAEVASIAYAVKTSVETMIELELYKELMIRRQDKKNRFLNHLLYEENTSRVMAETLATRLGYTAGLPRAPILLRFATTWDAAEALKVIKATSVHSKEDISATVFDGGILIFKSLVFQGQGILEAYTEQIETHVEAAKNALLRILGNGAQAGSAFRAYAGAFQSDFSRYRGAFRQIMWLSERYPQPREPVLYFYRRLSEYLASRLPRSELIDTMGPIASLLPPDLAASLGNLVDVFFASSFNSKEAAARLGVHRNTVHTRLERIRSILGLDYRSDPRARELVSLLVHYIDLTRNI